jgi:hypothetical protein
MEAGATIGPSSDLTYVEISEMHQIRCEETQNRVE